MSQRIDTLRGMHDVLHTDVHAWQSFESHVRTVMSAYGYQELRTPILEDTALFKRSLGEATDIVEKEMFTFVDRDKRSIALRPENTASCVRSAIQHGFLYQGPQRLWCIGPMFRHEKPQKGRYRQFHQVDVEAFGFAQADIEFELIALGERLWRSLGISEQIRLELNTLGTAEERAGYRETLVAYLTEHKTRLDEDSLRRLETNPLRILDTKNPAMQALVADAPKLWDNLGESSRERFETLCAMLQAAGIEYQVSPRLVRGLDYYTHVVFEWTTDRLGAQSAVCAGGRYDGLIEQLGGRATPGIGFAMGIERLLLLIEACGAGVPAPRPHASLVLLGERAGSEGMVIAERLRDAIPNLRLQTHCGGGSIKSQMKRADKSGAAFALIVGDTELDNNSVVCKPLREDREQSAVSFDELTAALREVVDAETNNTRGVIGG
ncbi:MAG: histidine--tRNA ligase [Gammaproteobacteria bacterium]|nr:histidine--tRNA ligase [Gammaproteobacteria bacterium]